ncbi:unnamed protein product [Prorocentrum cordatum]|uniref:DOMON domain-containing protein n=1 Tax=Prorocentrum cordatum TaxID=2364126 RepID=A0ABN9VPS4_9DINO|nr:unnamed protein product [Polarella glacialis]
MPTIALRLVACVAQLSRMAADVTCFGGNGNFIQDQWPFCKKVHDDVLIYYGPSAEGSFLKLGLYAAGHSGWSALAFAGNGGMKGAQQFVVRQEGGTWIAEERYSTDYAPPQMQETQDLTLIFASEEKGGTAWGLLLPRISCGAGDRYPVEDVSRWMHWALGSSHSFAYHSSKRGQFHVNLLSGPSTLPDLPSLEEVDVLMPDVDVVLGKGGNDPTNPYICGIFDLAQLLPANRSVLDKHHVVKFVPKLSASSEQYVHHMILYSCDSAAAALYDKYVSHNQVIGDCRSMPPACNALKWAWAVGSEDVVLPADVGMPFGQNVRWLALQMHYHNPLLVAGVKDSSGVMMIFSDSLRTHDAAVFDLNGGTSPNHRNPLPAGQADITLSTVTVPEQCTNAWDVPSINVLGVLYHGHLVGKSFGIDITSSADGSYRGTLRQEKRYDFNHQNFEPPLLNTISRGDELTLTCKYDTSSRTEPTEFGDATKNEMCWGAFMYYPAQMMTGAMIDKGSVLTTLMGKKSIRCAGVGQLSYTAPVVAPPACMQLGDLSSVRASNILSTMTADLPATWISKYTTTTTMRKTPDLRASLTSSPAPTCSCVLSVIGAFVLHGLLHASTM